MELNLRIRSILILGILFSLSTDAYVQRVVINNSGERIIMYPDGTWRPVQASDSILLQQYANHPKEFSAVQVQEPDPRKRNKAEEQEFQRKQWNGLYLDLVAEEKEVQDHFRNATNAQFKASEEFQVAEANKKLMEPDKFASLHEEYEASIINLKKAKLQQKDIRSLLDKANKINAKPGKISQAKINNVRTSFTLYLTKHATGSRTSIPAEVPATKPTAPVTPPPVLAAPAVPVSYTADPAKYDPKMIDKRPPGIDPKPYSAMPYHCRFDSDTLDQVTGKHRLEMHPEVLFTHTDADLRPFFKHKDLITCRARISRIGAYTYLSVEFQIASSHSQSNFGSLEEGSLLRFKLMNGEYVSLYNLKTHKGRIDPYSGYTIFGGQYALGKTELKKLSSSEADQMRVMWSTGFEDYDIFKVELLMDQLNCIKNKK